MAGSESRPRYRLLDGLRGVAALMVIVYHCYECFPSDTWLIGHGYLAVDFFFILSGFVIGYAYDGRWRTGDAGKGMTFADFAKRRLARLHPMVVFGVVLGLVCFLIQGGTAWDGSRAAVSALMLSTLLALFLIPCAPGGAGEVRGNGEMFPLNGPHWSLFFEYIGNIVYALLLRRLPTKALAAWTAALGLLFAWFFVGDSVGYGNIGVGWTLDGCNFWGGLLRMGFSYSAGLLISRLFRPMKIRGAFWKCSLLIVALLSVPCLGSGETAWVNCLYETVCVMLVFPLVLWMGASGSVPESGATSKLCSFIGEISYPLYAVHYPTMYLFYAYIGFPETFRTPAECWPLMAGLIAGNILLAYAAMRFYERPVRRIAARFLHI